MITKKDIHEILKYYKQGYTESKILELMTNNPDKQASNMCSESEATIILCDSKDRNYFFNDKAQAESFWRENNYYNTTRNSKIRLMEWIDIKDNNKRVLRFAL